MLKQGHGTRLGSEPVPKGVRSGRRSKSPVQQFDGDDPLVRRVRGTVDGAHATRTEHIKNFVLPYRSRLRHRDPQVGVAANKSPTDSERFVDTVTPRSSLLLPPRPVP